MERRLLLTSQGIQPGLKRDFLENLPQPPEKIRVAFVTTAAYGTGEPKPEWLEIYRKQLRAYGINSILDLDIRHRTTAEIDAFLADKNLIFVNGGNTFFLLDWVRRSGFGDILKRILNSSRLYVGVSAGSYICCPTIEQSTWKHPDTNRIGLTDLTALNFVPFLITAHYTNIQEDLISEKAKTTLLPSVTLTDNQAVLAVGDRYRICGTGERLTFNGFSETG